jgi:hypothetical protein
MNLDSPGTLAQLAKRIKEDIDAYSVKVFDDGPREHLGASIIGHPCARYSWSTFRWIYHKKYTGRMYRLFERGKLEEARFIKLLRGIGFEVWETTEDGEQHRVIMAQGHGGGSLDGVIRFPQDYDIDEPLLVEFKTNGTGRGFTELKRGVTLAKPIHFAQMSLYGYKYNLQYALYMNVNKNDDDIHIEIVKLNWILGRELETKMGHIIASQEPPAKIAESPAYFECKYCDYVDHCHNQRMPDKNCRSCVNAKPIVDAKWHCVFWEQVIPTEFIKQGCGEWKGLI